MAEGGEAVHEDSGGGSMPKVATSKAQTISYPAPGARPHRNDDFAVDPHVVVLFGATGDLARRKLIPGLAYLDQSELAPNIQIVATSLEDISRDDFLEMAKAAIDEFGTHKLTKEQWDPVRRNCHLRPAERGSRGACRRCRGGRGEARARTSVDCTICRYRRKPPAR